MEAKVNKIQSNFPVRPGISHIFLSDHFSDTDDLFFSSITFG